ncbi:MAG: VWA domain-containing protein [Acidobacteria bacterium]|nr:VWA domain-containing protein [Acidobacteriota bacterium]
MRRLAAANSLLVAVCLTTPVMSQQPVFRSGIELVRVDVGVTRGRRPIGNLKASDFEVFDNGVKQRIESADVEQLPLDAILILDVSGSVRGEKLRELRQAAEAFSNGLQPADAAALITLSHEISLPSDLTADRSIIAAALQQSLAAGATSLRDGIYAALALRRSEARRNVVLVFTDGLDNASWLTEDQLRTAVQHSNSLLYVVGLRRPEPDRVRTIREMITRSERFITRLVESTGGRVWHAESSDWLKRAFLEVLEDIRTRYVLTYYPTDVASDGWHTLTVQVKRSGLTVQAREGYFAGR